MKYLMVVLIPLVITAGTVSRTFFFSPYEIVTSKVNCYDLISLPGHLYTSEVGNPALPRADYAVLLPPTAEITSVDVVDYRVIDIPGSFNVFPVQRPTPLSLIRENTELTQPNPLVYNSKEPYPNKLADFTPPGCMSGYRIAGFTLYPVQYIPVEKKLRFYTEFTVKINYEEGRHELISLSKGQVEFFANEVKGMVINPEDLIRWAPSVKVIRDSTDYLIITGGAYVSTLQPVADWKTKKGYYTKILSTDSIYPRYPGRDNAEKVRNCIKDYWQNRGTKWVLLAGDIGVVPYRTLYVNAGGTTDYIPSDLYFADLQWSYDGNRNNIFGECPFNGDTVDLYYDVYLGRASIDNLTQANTFVLKDTIYEKHPEPNYMVRMLLCTGGSDTSANNTIGAMPPIPPWNLIKLYETSGNLTGTACRETLNTGTGFANFQGWGTEDGFLMSNGSTYYTHSSSVYALTNTMKYIIANAIPCLAGAFDRGSVGNDCYAENFVNAPNGGAVAAIFNSRYAWDYPGNIIGPSESFNIAFYGDFFNYDSFFEIGKSHSISKHRYRNSAQAQAVWRWCYYELNLFGDPELPMWGLKPIAMAVSHANTVPRGPQNYRVNVRSVMGQPLADALLCLWKEEEVYVRGKTDAAGNVTLAINPRTDGSMSVTATAKNHLPYEHSCTVGIEEEKALPPLAREIKLGQNPARGKVVIHYSLPVAEKIQIDILDITGRKVATWPERGYSGLGGIVMHPENLACGVYFIQIRTDMDVSMKRLVFMR